VVREPDPLHGYIIPYPQVFPDNQFPERGGRRRDPKHTFILMTDEKERGISMDDMVPEDEPCEQ
jgi:hypothetical protein